MNSSGTVTAVNCFGPDGLVSRQSGGAWTYYTFDQQGNVAVRQNSDGSISSRSTFDAYGAETATNSPSDPYAYNGQWGYYYDRETGLYYCQNRYYDPSQGRWLNRDPIGYSGGVNLYGYCEQSPIGAIDPEGLMGKGGRNKGRGDDWLYDLSTAQLLAMLDDPSTPQDVIDRIIRILKERGVRNARKRRSNAVPEDIRRSLPYLNPSAYDPAHHRRPGQRVIVTDEMRTAGWVVFGVFAVVGACGVIATLPVSGPAIAGGALAGSAAGIVVVTRGGQGGGMP